LDVGSAYKPKRITARNKNTQHRWYGLSRFEPNKAQGRQLLLNGTLILRQDFWRDAGGKVRSLEEIEIQVG
jgi:hypothetical protein